MKQEDLRKKRSQKRGSQVPVQELGFKSKLYYGLETDYTRRRVRYKAVKYGPESSKQCFMARLRFTLDVTSLSHQDLESLGSFKGIKKQEWGKVKHIVYHSKQELSCPICLQDQLQAPQMTSCGHLFCWHCILMHYYKSLKANHCPVCNQALELEYLVSCLPIYSRGFPQLKQNRVHFTLMGRRDNDTRVYHPETLAQAMNFARIVKALPDKILALYQEQLQSIQTHAKNQQDPELKKWIEKVHAACWDKIDKLQQTAHKKDYKIHRKQRLQNSIIYTVLDEKERGSLVTFYQEATGRLIFLHPLCEKYLRKSQRSLPHEITEQILYWEEAEYNVELIKKYKNISHITINEEIDFIIVNMQTLIEPDLLTAFQEELQLFKERKHDEMEREDREAEKLAAKYEEQKQYLAKLKKMEESQFYDIRVPVTIDPSEIGDINFFPSLIQTRSTPHPASSPPKEPEKEKNGKPQPIIIKQEDFPGLKLEPKQTQPSVIQVPQRIVTSKSQQPSPSLLSFSVKEEEFPGLGGGKKQESKQVGGKIKKKKQKFVNVTDMFFKDREEGV